MLVGDPFALVVTRLVTTDHCHTSFGFRIGAESFHAYLRGGLVQVAADGVPGHQPELKVL